MPWKNECGSDKKGSGSISLKAACCETTGPRAHAELGLSRQKVDHLETVPSFLGIFCGEILGRQVLGDSGAATLHGRLLLCVKHMLIHAEHTHEFKTLN